MLLFSYVFHQFFKIIVLLYYVSEIILQRYLYICVIQFTNFLILSKYLYYSIFGGIHEIVFEKNNEKLL